MTLEHALLDETKSVTRFIPVSSGVGEQQELNMVGKHVLHVSKGLQLEQRYDKPARWQRILLRMLRCSTSTWRWLDKEGDGRLNTRSMVMCRVL